MVNQLRYLTGSARDRVNPALKHARGKARCCSSIERVHFAPQVIDAGGDPCPE